MLLSGRSLLHKRYSVCFHLGNIFKTSLLWAKLRMLAAFGEMGVEIDLEEARVGFLGRW